MSIDLPLNTESNDMIILTLNSLSKNFLRLNIVIRVIIDSIRVNYSFCNFFRYGYYSLGGNVVSFTCDVIKFMFVSIRRIRKMF
jgi:hypothetical protein